MRLVCNEGLTEVEVEGRSLVFLGATACCRFLRKAPEDPTNILPWPSLSYTRTPNHHKTNLQANTWQAPLLPAAPFRIRAAPDTAALTAPRAVAISIGGVTVIAPYSTAAPVRLKFMGGRAVIPRPATTAKRVATGVGDRRARLRLLRAQHQKCPCSSSRCVFAQLPDCLLTAD